MKIYLKIIDFTACLFNITTYIRPIQTLKHLNMETKTQTPENLNLKYLDLHLDQIKNLITSTGTFIDSRKIEYAECVTLLQSIIESKKDRLENVKNNIETDALVYDVERIHKLRLIELITQL